MEIIKKALLSMRCAMPDNSEKDFLRNGSLLLKELVALSDGRSKIQLRNFSPKEIAEATNNFDSRVPFHRDFQFKTFRGSFEKCQILVKKYVSGPRNGSSFARDIAISSQMSFHKNALKLIGYCFEFEGPALVYQSPDIYDTLYYRLFSMNMKLTLNNKLNIACDIANVLAYLHTGFRTPIIYRDLTPRRVVIDKYGTTKFADFSLCIAIPLGESQVEDDVLGTYRYADPKYVLTGVLTVKSDVYNFGVLLIVLLTGKQINSCLDNETPFDILSGYIEGILNGEEQTRACAELALKCIGEERESRPEMIDVAKELRRIQRSTSSVSTS